MEILKLKKFEGSVTTQEFIHGLAQAKSRAETPGHLWEQTIDCNHCSFKEQCQTICEATWPAQKLNCRDVVNLLLGEVRLEDLIK